MSAPGFPFAALVGLEPLKIALRLAAIDRRLSVLVRGEKGTGKSTAARALGGLLAEGSRFVNLPIGATEDRVLGGLDIDRALRGESALKPGLLADAHGGVLYIDEVNLLPDHLANAMLDAVATGVHIVEREGFSARQEADFVLVGSMNPAEGTLRPQLLDRFALVVDVSAPSEAVPRAEAVRRRLAFDADAAAFCDQWRSPQQAMADSLGRARGIAGSLVATSELLDLVSRRVCEHGVQSLRADLAIVRASRALAALEGASEVTAAHVEAVLPFVLGHRAREHRQPSPPPQPSRPAAPEAPAHGAGDIPPERVFDARPMAAPRIVVTGEGLTYGAGIGGSREPRQGVVIGAQPLGAREPREVDLRATMVHALAHTGSSRVRREDLHETVRTPVAARRFLFVVDSSGSQAALERMRLVKGAVAALLDTSVRRHDEVAVVAFRGTHASIALPPTKSAEEALAALAYLPTGGRTPLAHALEVAGSLVTAETVLILLTDGRANVPTRTADPWADALQAATRITCPVLVIDSESGPNPTHRAAELAARMQGTHVAIDSLDEVPLLDLVRPINP